MTDTFQRLAALGWSNQYARGLEADEWGQVVPARVVAVHRDGLEVAAADFTARVPQLTGGAEEADLATVGDFVLLDPATRRPRRIVPRKSLFRRKAPGTGRGIQLIAANVDTLFVVTSCNQDFNVARLERYLALAREADVTPVAILTKADLADDADTYAAAAARLMPGLLVERLDARDPAAARALAPWCGPGQTVALVGSSGVGKSTLVNTLTGAAAQPTAGIREDDAHGRHTTTGRSMHRLASGGWLIDTPGMRELQLAGADAGIGAVFADVDDIARGCRFADCRHDGEPGCAVAAAAESGALDPDRLRRYRKLVAEDARNSESIRERRSRERGFGRLAREAVRMKQGRRDP